MNRIGSAAEIGELEWMLNSGSSSEWGDDQLPDDDQLIGTQVWTETSPDQLVVIWRSNFHQTGFTEVKINDADDRPHLVRLKNLSQLTRSGERTRRSIKENAREDFSGEGM